MGCVTEIETTPQAFTPAPTRWITRERPKIDRIACPWLVRRFVDPRAMFLFVPAGEVIGKAKELDAIPFDVPGVTFSHVDEKCSFDAFIEQYELDDPALDRLALIVRGADTGRLELAPECAGLLAVSLGISASAATDEEALELGFPVYDALYAWARDARGETHGWPPQ